VEAGKAARKARKARVMDLIPFGFDVSQTAWCRQKSTSAASDD
jgi:hypothetical protein